MVDVWAIADAVAAAAATHFGVSATSRQAHGVLGGNGKTRSTPQSSSGPEVYELLGRGRAYLLAASMFEVPKAVAAFRAADRLGPNLCRRSRRPGAGLLRASRTPCGASRRCVRWSRSLGSSRSGDERHKYTDAQVALGAVLYLSEWNWIGAAKSLERALELNPNHTEAYLLYGRLLETLANWIGDSR